MGPLPAARGPTAGEAATTDLDQFNLYIGLEAGATRIESYDTLWTLEVAGMMLGPGS